MCLNVFIILAGEIIPNFVSNQISPVENKLQVTSQDQDPGEQMQREVGGATAVGFDPDVASHISHQLSLQRQSESNRVSFTPDLNSRLHTLSQHSEPVVTCYVLLWIKQTWCVRARKFLCTSIDLINDVALKRKF